MPDSRNPLIPTEVRAKIESIEADARTKGWPPELLYNSNFWDYPRGLAAILDANDEITESDGRLHRDSEGGEEHPKIPKEDVVNACAEGGEDNDETFG
jgi:hypothetical protein